MRRLGLALRAAYSLAAPYWRSASRRRATALLSVVIALNVALVGTTVLFTYWQGAFYNALEAKDWNGFIGSLLWWHSTPKEGFTLGFAPVLAAFVLITASELYLRQALQISWRQWMTEQTVTEWLADRSYLRMALLDKGTDNPDQRIAEDIRLFVDNTLLYGLGLIRSAVSVISFLFLLWTLSEPIVVRGVTIHGYLVWVAVFYAVIGTWLTHLAGNRLTPLHYLQQRAEADFRFSLMRLRENVEAVAFYRGEAEQGRELRSRFTAVVDNWHSIMTVTLRLTLLTTGYGQVMLVFPLAVVAPSYFAGRIPLGGIFQTSNAFVQVQNSLSWVVTSYADLTGWLATVERLADFRDSLQRTRAREEGPTVIVGEADQMALVGLELARPNGDRLLRPVDLSIARGDRLLITGRSGAGKSTLLRAIAGIWPFGSGIVRSNKSRHLFMPQRPYMPLGTLRRALCYPANETTFSDGEIAAALHDVDLARFMADLDTVDDWQSRLSGGEQQRLTLGRALLIRPEWLFLDEATSGLDPAAEEIMYLILSSRLPETTLLSIAHRPEVARFHTRVLSIEDGVLHEVSVNA